jgi:hypothetical protein
MGIKLTNMKKLHPNLTNDRLNESRKEYNRIVLGEQRRDEKPKKIRPGRMEPLSNNCADPNARKIMAISCETGGSAFWGCATVNDGVTPQQVPQVGQVLSGFGYMSNTPNIPLYYKISSVDPGDPSVIGGIDFPMNPLHMGCGFDCDPTTYDCIWNANGTAAHTNYNSCIANCTQPQISGCTDSSATNYDPTATFDDGSCTFTTPCMKVTLINTCPQNSSYSTYYGTPGVPSPGGSWNMNWGQGPNFGCATIDGQTPTLSNVGTFIEGGTGVSGEQWEVFSIDPPTSNYVYDLNTTTC